MANLQLPGVGPSAQAAAFLNVVPEFVSAPVVPASTGMALGPPTDANFSLHASTRPVLIYSGPPCVALVNYTLTFRRTTTATSNRFHFVNASVATGAIPTSVVLSATSLGVTSQTGRFIAVSGAGLLNLVDTSHIGIMYSTFLATEALECRGASMTVVCLR